MNIPGIIPQAYWMHLDPCWAVTNIVVNWLDIEVDAHVEERLPALKQMHGFRNLEVHDYVKVSYANVLNALIPVMYGYPGAVV